MTSNRTAGTAVSWNVQCGKGRFPKWVYCCYTRYVCISYT